MKRAALKRPGTYTWALAIILLASTLWPAIMQVRGLAGFVTEQPGIVQDIHTENVYNANDGIDEPVSTYTFKNSTTGQTYTPSGYHGSYSLISGSAVRLGVVNDTLVSVDGEAIDQMGFGGRFLFGMACGLIVLASSMTALERFSKKKEPTLSPVLALVVGLVIAIPAALVGILTVMLSTVAEYTLHFAFWPVLELALAVGASWFVYTRPGARRAAKA